MKGLNLGSGSMKLKGFETVDFNPNIVADHHFDLTKTWVLKNNTYDYIVAHHIIEHMPDYKHFFNELLRVCKDGAKFDIHYPNYTVAHKCAQHRSFFGLDLFVAEENFIVTYRRLEWARSEYNKNKLHKILNRIINAVVNKNWKYQDLAERLGIGGGFLNIIQRGYINKKLVSTSEANFRGHDLQHLLPYLNDDEILEINNNNG